MTFPDYHEEVELLAGAGDYVAWRSIGTGTQFGTIGPFPAQADDAHAELDIIYGSR